MASKASGGLGILLAVNTGTASSPTYTPIGEQTEITPSGWENKVEEVTNLQSTAVERAYVIQDGGTWDFTANRVSTDTGQAKMQSLFASGAMGQFQLTFTKEGGQSSTGDVATFNAIVTKWLPSIKADKITKSAGSLATSNGITYVEGS